MTRDTGSYRIVGMETYDVRFPTSRELDGSDAMNPDPDYSAAYVILRTDDGYAGHGFAFTIGRGNDVQTGAITALEPYVVGRDAEDLGALYKEMVYDSQLRWLGPEKGVMHMAISAVVNALWDLKAKRAGKPLWLLLAEMSPEEIVELVDFRYLSDALTPDEALRILKNAEKGKQQRIEHLKSAGYPAYTTSPGWLGYPDDKLRRLCREAVAAGWKYVKIKVGADLDDDIRRCAIVREEIGVERRLMVDANQAWDVDAAISWMHQLAPFDPWWIEEPTSPDDILGHARIRAAVRPIGVATGEHCQNRVVFKQLMQAEGIDFCQIDACRLGGVNEVLAVLLLAAKFGVPVCPHAGGVGLCEYVQHLSLIDYICVSGRLENRVIEYVDHLHEHFRDPVRMVGGRYMPPDAPGYSIEMKPESLRRYEFPNGPAWC